MEDGDADLEVDLWPFRKAVPEPITRRRVGNDLHIPSDTLNVDVCFDLGTYRRRDEDVSSHIAIEIAFDGRVVEVCKNLETTGIVNAVEFELAQSTGSAMLTGTRLFASTYTGGVEPRLIRKTSIFLTHIFLSSTTLSVFLRIFSSTRCARSARIPCGNR